MCTVDKIVAAAAQLSPAQLVKLRRKLDRLEDKTWQAESKAVAAEMKRRNVTDEMIDRKVTRRRREGRML